MKEAPLQLKIREIEKKKKLQKQAKKKTIDDDWFTLDEIEDIEETGF